MLLYARLLYFYFYIRVTEFWVIWDITGLNRYPLFFCNSEYLFPGRSVSSLTSPTWLDICNQF